jgi:hypothetical protein
MAKKTGNTGAGTSGAITAQKQGGYAALASADFGAMLAEELDGLDISFEKIKIPSGGSTVFEAPSEDGDGETVREFSGVILHQHPLFMYYKTKYTGGSNPPDCGSFDGKFGVGDPGGSCAKCPLNVFGTGENGAKACKNRRRIYILREGELFPILLSLPTGSLRGYTRFLQKQLSKGKKPWQFVTRFSLKKAVNSSGIAYSQAQFAKDRDLTEAELAVVAPFSEQIKSYSRNIGFDADASDAREDYVVDEETGEIIEPLGGGADV